jgi:nitroreductase
MTAKSTSNRTSKPKAKSTAKPATKPKAAAKAAKPATKPKAPAKSASKPRAPAKAAAKAAKPEAAAKAVKPKAAAKAVKPRVTGASAPELAPLEAVRPLIRVRQMRDFSPKRVTNAELEAITEVARWSGSSRNEQPCRFIAIRDKELIERVAELGLPQTRGLPTANAAIAIVVPDEPERELSRAFDDGRAAERIVIAANLLGMGGGISRVRVDVREGINKALRLPPNRSVRTIVAIGHPSADALAPKSKPGKARLPREEVIFEERWPEPPKPSS